MNVKFVEPVKGACYRYGSKELVRMVRCVGVVNGEITTLVQAYFYMGRSSSASVVYCNLWVNGECRSGSGSAGGGGYDKFSAALAEAYRNAGITLDTNIAGVGDSAIRKSMLAVGAATCPSASLLTII